jgi:hypothetical protein
LGVCGREALRGKPPALNVALYARRAEAGRALALSVDFFRRHLAGEPRRG